MTPEATVNRRRGRATSAELEEMVVAGEIDTVIVAFADLQGRLVGKRVSARLFIEEVAAHGAECCNYLPAVDVAMNTVSGYAMSSWESGYGDMVIARNAFGDRLVEHYLNNARVESAAFNSVVTDWERVRCFERF